MTEVLKQSRFVIQRDHFRYILSFLPNTSLNEHARIRLNSNSNLTDHRKIKHERISSKKRKLFDHLRALVELYLHVLVSPPSFQVTSDEMTGTISHRWLFFASTGEGKPLEFPLPGSLQLATSFSRVFSVRQVCWETELSISCRLLYLSISGDSWTRDIDVSIDGGNEEYNEPGLSRQFIQCLGNRFIIYQIFRIWRFHVQGTRNPGCKIGDRR